MKERTLMPLSMVAPGKEVELMAVHGGWGIHRRLAEMGLNPGVRIRVTRSDPHGGPIIVIVRDTRLALGRGMAHKIMVKPIALTQSKPVSNVDLALSKPS